MRFYQASAVLLIASLAGRFIDNERSRDTYCRLLHSATLHMIVRGVVVAGIIAAGINSPSPVLRRPRPRELSASPRPWHRYMQSQSLGTRTRSGLSSEK